MSSSSPISAAPSSTSADAPTTSSSSSSPTPSSSSSSGPSLFSSTTPTDTYTSSSSSSSGPSSSSSATSASTSTSVPPISPSSSTTSSTTISSTSPPPTTSSSEPSSTTTTSTSPSETLSPPAETSSSNPGSSSSNGSTTTPASGTSRGSSTTSAPASVSTVFQTTVIVTDPGGATYTSVSQVTSLVAAAPTGSSTSSGSSSHVGAIVGGIIGGIAGVAALGLLVLFFLRRRKRLSDFDGNFDPDRVVNHTGGGGTLPHVDLAGAEITPYPLGAPGEPPNMAQYHDTGAPGFLPVAAAAGARPPSHYTTSEYTQSSFYPTSPTSASGHAMPDYPGRHPSPGPSLATNSTSYQGTSATGRSAKEREALNARYQNQLGVVNPDIPEGGSSAGGSGEVIQHRDGGRLPVNVEEEGPSEIPPRYDEIPANER
ncbi:hypothetical protein NEOLEDRAFT_1163094 [Neolentinus lepideus HHB14362 ss-1]|uniref:REJ domain-containing protein n=1 Tax=Neolentinus lepideus HHB14362 ss-1 TaxID=1314782 RepID=A0A165S3N9_9AGAM|nr:hypothetical protein NEOLEDRAFT_1163094 [Neolentinus lepideus HHB14362 ss-1]